MKILITYHSQTGNTERIARAIHAELSPSHEVVMANLGETPAALPSDVDLLFVGSPCHAGTLSGPVKSLLASLPGNPLFHAAGFVTHASPAYNRTDYEQCMSYFSSAFKKIGAAYHGCFECQGELTPKLYDFLKKSRNIPDEEWEQMVSDMKGHPDGDDEERARQFARDVALKAGQS